MLIAKIQDGAVVDVADYRAMFVAVVFPDGGPTDEWLVQNSCMRVNLYKPYDSLTEKLESVPPYIEGQWVYTVAVRSMTAQEIADAKASAMGNIRAQRNAMLSATDWRYRRDQTTTPDWDAYCQALRDLPATIQASGADPRTFTDWPKSPDWKPMPV